MARSADALLYDADNLPTTGRGTILFDVLASPILAPGANYMVVMSDGSTTDNIGIQGDSLSGGINKGLIFNRTGGTLDVAVVVPTVDLADGVVHEMRGYWTDGVEMNAKVDSTAGTADTAFTLFTGFDEVAIGTLGDGSDPSGEYVVGHVRIYKRARTTGG